MNANIIRRTILAELGGAAPYMLPQPQLLLAVNLRVRPQIDLKDLVTELSWLRDREMIDYQPDQFDPENRDARQWYIREAGLAQLKR